MFRPILIAAVVLGMSLPALASSQTVILIDPADAASAPSPGGASPYSEDELQKFAGAAVVLQRISDDVAPRLEAAVTPEEQQELAQAASVEMVQAVEGRGMSVDKFQEILWQAQTNPVIAQQVVQHIQNLQR